MSLIVTVYVNDGIVMASDSRATITNTTVNGNMLVQNNFPLSDSAYKTFLCCNNCGISTCGAANFNNKPISGYIEHFIQTEIDKNTLVTEIPQKLLVYFNRIDKANVSIFHICGYEKINEQLIQHVYIVSTGSNPTIREISSPNSYGATWNGEIECLLKLLKRQIIDPQMHNIDNLELTIDGNRHLSLPHATILDRDNIQVCNEANIAWEYLSLQDAIDFAKYAIETTIKTMQFQTVAKTVGGPIDILTITPKGAKWIKHKKING